MVICQHTFIFVTSNVTRVCHNKVQSQAPLLTCEVAGSDGVEQAELLLRGALQSSSSACSWTHGGGTIHRQSLGFIHQPVHQVAAYKIIMVNCEFTELAMSKNPKKENGPLILTLHQDSCCTFSSQIDSAAQRCQSAQTSSTCSKMPHIQLLFVLWPIVGGECHKLVAHLHYV